MKDCIELRIDHKLSPYQILIYFDKGGAAIDTVFVTQKELEEKVEFYRKTMGLVINLVYMHPTALQAYNKLNKIMVS
jgi:hypothetical protein